MAGGVFRVPKKSETPEALLLARADYARFLVEYGFDEKAVRAAVEDMADHADMPAGYEKFELSGSPIQGRGLFCVAPIQAGEVVAPARIDKRRTIAGRCTNHSPAPNCRFEPVASGLMMVSRRPIAPGEELTVDYRQVGSINGWAPTPSYAETLATLRWRAQALRHLGNPWADWAEASEGRLRGILDQMLARHAHLPSMAEGF